jgi:hypothetical protein
MGRIMAVRLDAVAAGADVVMRIAVVDGFGPVEVDRQLV